MIKKMKIYFSVFLALQLYGIITSNETGIRKNNSELNYIDVLKEDLLNHNWDKEETTCLDKLLDIMNNVKNSTLWAVWIWDSMQTPAGLLYGSQYSLGNYDQCLNPPWLETHPEYRTQYCLVDVKLSQTEPNNTIGDPHRSVKHHINSVSKYKLKFNKLTWGVCIPAECKTESTSKFVKTLLKYTYLGSEINKINPKHCQVAGTTPEFTWDFYLFIFLIIIIIIITAWCTIHSKKTTNNNINDNKVIKAFCLSTNASSLNKISKDDINVLHGLRSLASFVVIGLHVVFLTHTVGFGNSLTLERDMDRLKIKALLRADYAVDVFLLMSGLLRIKSYMAIGKINPFKAILKRYLRYFVTIGLIILCMTSVHNHVGDGPIWNMLGDEESRACKKNWLITLLMLGNYVDNTNICYPVLWTVPCDFHLSVIATILYWIYEKNKKAAITIFGVLMTVAIILPGFVTYQQNLMKIFTFDFRITGNYKTFMSCKTYMLTHLRGGPYFIGIALGYIMSIYKPNRYRNIFSKVISSIGTIIALSVIAIIISMVESVQDNPDNNDFLSYVISSAHRSIFTLGICCIIVMCEYGSVPLLGSFLTWRAFIPISKISYGIYLVHCMIYGRMVSTTRAPMLYDALLMLIHTLAVISLSCMVGLVLHLLVEAPTNKITDIMLNNKTDTGIQDVTSGIKNGVPYKNGVKKNI